MKVAEEGVDKDDDDEDDQEDEYDDDIMAPPGPEDPEFQWKLAQRNHGVSSESMDKLMALTGMREVKARAVTVCKEVLLAKKRPAHIKASVCMVSRGDRLKFFGSLIYLLHVYLRS